MIPTAQPWKTAVLAVFTVLCALMFAYLYSGTGAKLPFASAVDYRTTFVTADAGNLATASDVRIAGVTVGEVEEIDNRGAEGARITLRLDDEAAPLHEGAKARVGERSLVGEGMVTITDGKGAEIPSGTVLAAENVAPAVQLHDVIRDLDAPTRESLRGLVRGLGDGTEGREKEIAQLFDAMGYLGSDGATVVDAIAAQSKDLKHLVRSSSDVLRALNTSQGQLGDLVESSNRITRATSVQAESISATVERLPATLAEGRTAFRELGGLARDLRPVATNLRVAAPHLTTALEQLPATTADLRGLLPSLDRALTKAPATLDRVPTFAGDVSALVPDARDILAQANPMLRYISPYGRDLAAFFTNFAGVMATTDEAGLNYIRLAPIMGNTVAISGVPVYTGELTHTENPYPAPGGAENPTGHQREFTRIEADPR